MWGDCLKRETYANRFLHGTCPFHEGAQLTLHMLGLFLGVMFLPNMLSSKS